MRNKKIITIIYLSVVTSVLLTIIYYVNPQPIYQDNIISIIIIFAILLLVLSFLIFFDKLRKKIYRITLFDLISLKRWTYYIACVCLSLFFINYYSLSSRINDNILPQSFQFNVIQISAILGGLVLTASSIKASRINNQARKKLLFVACELIGATVLLIIYVVATYWAYKDGNPLLFVWDPSSNENILRGLAVFTLIPCFFIGHPLFLMGIFDLLGVIYQLVRKLNLKMI